ncbi:hypothetical protein [Mycolicibacterium komossense]|uniref:Uncharacterized protein n=1 Tax=Mycolicibacterium komossense TaxID=1779 RepID=A0ABT3CF03_9MYCO|nr:hypothetical protein [Mycolicibacterium komossense]MCV7228058.1 hypothetical protein [Mycolicibacterium komossense]
MLADRHRADQWLFCLTSSEFGQFLGGRAEAATATHPRQLLHRVSEVASDLQGYQGDAGVVVEPVNGCFEYPASGVLNLT